MTMPEFTRLKTIAEKEIKFTDDNIMQKLLDLPYLFHKYLDLYLLEKDELNILERKKKMKYAELYNHFKFKAHFALDSIKEIDTYVNGDVDYDKICLEYNRQEVIVTYFVEHLDNIKKSSFSMKSYVEMRKFLAGN